MTINYSMVPKGDGTRLRADHTTFAAVITSFGTSNLVQGDEIWIAPADGNEVKMGDKWLHVTHVDDKPLAVPGWMAYIHKGEPICKDFLDLTGGDTEPPPPVPAFPQSFELRNPDTGEVALYVFVRVLE